MICSKALQKDRRMEHRRYMRHRELILVQDKILNTLFLENQMFLTNIVIKQIKIHLLRKQTKKNSFNLLLCPNTVREQLRIFIITSFSMENIYYH